MYQANKTAGEISTGPTCECIVSFENITTTANVL